MAATVINYSKPLSLDSPCISSKKDYHPLKLFSTYNRSSFYFHSKVSLQWRPIKACTGDLEIDMVKTKDGVYAAKAKKVVVLWDLDNKPPRGPPFEAALALKCVAQKFGEVIDISAYANRHAFIHLPQWVVEERRERRRTDVLERKGLFTPSEHYACSVCGRKFSSHVDLKKHFRQLHERERQKKLSRMRSLKGKKRQRYRERFIDGNEKYNEAARSLLTPKIGYGLAQELKRAGVFVKTVEDKPQAADWALKRQMMHSMSRGIDWIVLVSDDSDFSEMLRKAKEANLGTVVVGDRDRALGRHADVWVPWVRVENREVKDSDLEPCRDFDKIRSGCFSVSDYDGELDVTESSPGHLDDMEFDRYKVSSFSEGEEDYEDDLVRMSVHSEVKAVGYYEEGNSIIFGDEDEESDYLLDSEDEDIY